MTDISSAKSELEHIQQKIVEGENAFSARSTELQQIIRDLTKRVRQLKEQAREYEEGMTFTRQADEARKVELDKHEADLKGRERRLGQEQQDFEHRKKRWQQLKDLQ